MSKYTTEVRFICEEKAGLVQSEGFQTVESIITAAAPKIFNFPWPIYDETYRLPLEVKILRHYYTREIGVETVGLWQLRLAAKLNEIMPYYNKLYLSEVYTFNPLYDVDLTRDRTGQRQTDTTGSVSASGTFENSEGGTISDEGTHWEMFQDTPQGALTNVIDNSYLTNATKNTIDDTRTLDTTNSGENSTETSSEESIKDVDSYIEHVIGSNGGMSYARKIMEYRESLLNIDAMIIHDLKDLFFLLW